MTHNAKSTTTTFNLVVLAFAIMLVGGLVAIPIIEEAQAANSVSESKNKGQQGEKSSEGKRQGHGGGGGGSGGGTGDDGGGTGDGGGEGDG